MHVPILAYHKVDNRIELGINSVPVSAFKSHIHYLQMNNYYSISLYDYVTGNYEQNHKRHPVIITFDDADESVYHHAFPILESSGFSASLFVISDYVGKTNSWDYKFLNKKSWHMNWNQLRELANNGWEIGSHTASHRDLTRLSSSELHREVATSKEVISEKISKSVCFISYPFNRFNVKVLNQVKRSGYSGGCALFVSKKMIGLSGNFNLKRYGVYSIDGKRNIKQKLNNSRFEHVKQGVISFCSRGTIWYNQIN